MLDKPEPPITAMPLALVVGQNVKAHRKLRRLTLKRLGELCGTTPQTIQRLEAGTMTLSMLWVEKLSQALGIQPHVLFGDIGMMDMERRERAMEDFRAEVHVFRERIDQFLRVTERQRAASKGNEEDDNADQELGAAGPAHRNADAP